MLYAAIAVWLVIFLEIYLAVVCARMHQDLRRLKNPPKNVKPAKTDDRELSFVIPAEADRGLSLSDEVKALIKTSKRINVYGQN